MPLDDSEEKGCSFGLILGVDGGSCIEEDFDVLFLSCLGSDMEEGLFEGVSGLGVETIGEKKVKGLGNGKQQLTSTQSPDIIGYKSFCIPNSIYSTIR